MSDKEEGDLLFEEYKALREEVLHKMDNQYKIVGLGMGGISILLGFAFEKGWHSLFFVLPLLIIASMLLLNAEISAILNAGEYIRTGIEGAVSNGKKIGWETWLCQHPEKTKVYEHFRYASLLIFATLYLTCLCGAVWYVQHYLDNISMVINTYIVIITIIFIYGLAGFIAFYNSYKSMRRQKLLESKPE